MPRVVVFLLCMAAATAASAGTSATAAYEKGVTAYRAEQFDEAAKHFENARRRGMRDPNLELNLGLTYYRLGRYPAARERFELLRQDLRYTAIADYHLGLIASRMGDRETAQMYFDAARFETANPWLRNMATVAQLRLDRMALDQDPFATTSAVPRPRFYLRTATGFDSNPELASDIADRPGVGAVEDGGLFADVRAELELPFLATQLGDTALRGDAWARPYGGETGYDELGGTAGLRQSFVAGNWRMGVTGEGGNSWLDGEAYQGTGAVGVDGRRRFESSTVTLRAESQQVDGDGLYNYLDGWRHRAGAEFAHTVGGWRGRSNYEYEINDRDDLTRSQAFSSYSPTRHSVGLALGTQLPRELAVEGRLRYRDSTYPDDNRFVDGRALTTERRDDRLFVAGVRGRVRAGETWNWLGDLQYSRNTSSLEEFDYTRHLLLFGVEWLR